MTKVCGDDLALLLLEDTDIDRPRTSPKRPAYRAFLRLWKVRLAWLKPSTYSDQPPFSSPPCGSKLQSRIGANAYPGQPSPPYGTLHHLLAPVAIVPRSTAASPSHRHGRQRPCLATAPSLGTIWGGGTPSSEAETDAWHHLKIEAKPNNCFLLSGLHMSDGHEDKQDDLKQDFRDTSLDSKADFLNIVSEEDLEELSLLEEDEAEAEAGKAEDEVRQQLDATRDDSQVLEAETMLAAFIREFGSLPSSNEPAEQWVASSSAVIMRTVSIRGSLLLTTRRLAFVALLPTAASGTSRDQNEGRGRQEPAHEHAEVIRCGPATIHFSGWRRSRTAWFELRADSLVCYRDSTRLYRPVGSGRLSDLSLLPISYSPLGKSKTTSKRVYLRAPTGLYALGFYSEETANDWHKDLQATIWRYRNSRERVRVAFDLRRAVQLRLEAHSHYVLATVSVATGMRDVQIEAAPNCVNRLVEDLTFAFLADESDFIEQLKDLIHAQSGNLDGVTDTKKVLAAPEPIIELENVGSRDGGSKEPPDSTQSLGARLVQLFTLNDCPERLKIVKAEIVRGMPLSGTLAIGSEYLIFWRHRLPPFNDIRVKIPLKDVVGVQNAKSLVWHHYQMKVHIRGHPSIGFRFTNQKQRDSALGSLREICEHERQEDEKEDDDDTLHKETIDEAGETDPMEILLKPARARLHTVLPYKALQQLPRLVNRSKLTSASPESMRVVCLTIGSRGDVQPYIALSKGLKAQGHSPVIVSHPEYKDWVEKHGIEFRCVGGDPGALMKLSVEHRLFSPAFFKESVGKFRSWLDELLRDCFEQCWDAELLIESPSTMAGIHVAEALQCFYFRAFTMPWTRTKHLPQAFAVPPVDLGEAYNWSSYTMFDRLFWQATSGQINRWRRHMLHLNSINFAELDQDSVPFVYNFSSAVVPHPIDWPDRITVTGYWFLDSKSEEWEPPKELLDFMDNARKDGKKLVYVGFGSITVPNTNKVMQNIYDAVRQADVRAIVSKGWSSRMLYPSGEVSAEPAKPREVYIVDAIPHDWLFPKIDVAMHHGGAGTTGASLRAGLVTLIHPFFGDQFFWAGRLQKLGAGARIGSLDSDDIAEALKKATTDRIMKEKAADVGTSIRAEDGVRNAISFIESHLESSKRKYHPLNRKLSKTKVSGGSEGLALAAAKTCGDEVSGLDEDDEDEDHVDMENDLTVEHDTSIVRRILSISGLGHALPDILASPRKSQSTFSAISPGPFSPKESEEQNTVFSRSSSYFTITHAHMPWFHANFFASLKALVPKTHPAEDHSDHGGLNAAEAATVAAMDRRNQEKKVVSSRDCTFRMTRKGSGEEDAQVQEQRKKESKNAKSEDERRRAAMEEKLRKRTEILAAKRTVSVSTQKNIRALALSSERDQASDAGAASMMQGHTRPSSAE